MRNSRRHYHPAVYNCSSIWSFHEGNLSNSQTCEYSHAGAKGWRSTTSHVSSSSRVSIRQSPRYGVFRPQYEEFAGIRTRHVLNEINPHAQTIVRQDQIGRRFEFRHLYAIHPQKPHEKNRPSECTGLTHFLRSPLMASLLRGRYHQAL